MIGYNRAMKLALTAVAALALVACATPKPASVPPTSGVTAPAVSDGIQFPLPRPKVGETVTETKERSMVATVEASPTQQVHLLSSEQRTELKQIVALDGDIVTTLKVTHRAVTNQDTVNGAPRARPTPTLGKTYLVWRAGGELQVSYVDGTAPPAAEIKAVRKGNRSVGRPEPLDRIVASRVWKIGERFELTAAQLAELKQTMSDDEEPELTSMTLTLHTVDAAVATMAMTMTMATAGAADRMTFDLTGTITLDRRTGRVLELVSTGPFSSVGKLKMVGTMTMRSRYAY